MKVRAAVLEDMGRSTPYATSRPLTIAEIELAPPGPGEVLVRIAAAGLCHSDLSVIDGSRPRPTPMALGHEAAGVVAGLGPGVDDLAIGDHVVLVFVPSCGHCLPCATGRPALCEPAAAANSAGTLLSGEKRITRNGATINHHMGVSAFADHAVVSRRSLVRIDKDIALEHAALFGCAVLTGVGAVVNTAQIAAGSNVAIVGLGGVGLSALLGALACGADRVTAIDLDAGKLAFARQLGATETFESGTPDAVATIREASKGGYDTVIELAGSAKALELAYAITKRGGTTVTGGLPAPSAMLQIPAVSLVAEERTLKGSYIGTCVPARDLPRYLNLFRRGRLPVDQLLTDLITLDDINAGFDRLREGKAIRQVVRFG
ncbi:MULTISPECIES: zinc-dependent alcohol dehydrogenase family protein [unclassified Beijerinckia]|uniref:zinc-dependent alcohol dehydrogenase family protein n=1 Tax=unclassified Beijerinckia TaxID=2638183 RepID=UPI0008947D50|nr:MULTISPECIES: zinc-dependent alcohol dehydrogenase family protein [unclassified Beijerinckia]MDH7798532.1 alcohol dehydrogenase [Beijerinckia sp. GAS462]SED24034.1 alcohol dehydrogenase [Beijerinckia sp. 28-YEA-48]